MNAATQQFERTSLGTIRILTYLMFFMFAMTTDSVGIIIPQVIREFGLTMTVGGAVQYASMLGIAAAGIALGFLADRLGRQRSILVGLSLFALTAFCFPLATSFRAVLALVFLAGIAIGVFKTGAVALVADISPSAEDLTRTMNLVEGFFGVGAIIGPLIVATLLERNASWRWLYVVAGLLCTTLFLLALRVRYPVRDSRATERPSLGHTLHLLSNPYALGFSLGAFAYVAVECAVYVWMPTLLSAGAGSASYPLGYALPAFFIMRAVGRFAGAWLLSRIDWAAAIAACAVAIFACFLVTIGGGAGVAVYALPLSGLFMSIIYPTLNSKGMGCFAAADHGAVAGVILFFTCAGAFLGPLAMAFVSDLNQGPRAGFVLATVIAGLLATGLVMNSLLKPAQAQLARFHAGELVLT